MALFAATLCGLLLSATRTLGQGCVRSTHLTSGLVSEGIWYLQPNEWDVFASYRYLYSDTPFQGGTERPDLIVPKTTIHSLDIGATYAINSRFSATLTLPFSYGESSTIQPDRQRHSMFAGGLGDIRLLGNVWLLDPAKHPGLNVSLSLGVKAPTGDDNAQDSFHTPAGTIQRPVLPNIQPGDGGWGIVLDVQGFAEVFERTYLYAGGSYLSNPRNLSSTEFTTPSNPQVYNSVPDQYSTRAGVQYTIWPKGGLALSLGGRFEGVPVRDLIGDSDGFRIAGYAISIEPGLSWTWKKNSLTVSAPVAVERHDEDTVLNQRTGTKGTGGFADFVISATYQRRF